MNRKNSEVEECFYSILTSFCEHTASLCELKIYAVFKHFKVNMHRLILLRHALAIKNIEDRHGGGGTPLSPSGVEQLNHLAEIFSNKGIEPVLVYCSPVPHSEETARFLSNKYKVPLLKESNLTPLNLGVLAGLSKNEARALYPIEAQLMEDWRQGRIELHELIIPGAEDYREFYNRGKKFLSEIEEVSGDVIIAGTRSILILLISILLGRTIEPGGGYKEISMECCYFFTFVKMGEDYKFDPDLSGCNVESLGK